ncbi:MAG TPA: hypothetical protein VIT67_18295 [Povalibacter sp.]
MSFLADAISKIVGTTTHGLAEWLHAAGDRNREWWRDATPSRVLYAIAGRGLRLAIAFVVMAVGTSLYAFQDQRTGAYVLMCVFACCAAWCVCFSARSMGELLALQLVPNPDDQLPVHKRRLLVLTALAPVAGLGWCAFRIWTYGYFGSGLVRGPIVTAVMATVAMTALAYIAIACARAHALTTTQPPFHEALEADVYARKWYSVKNYRRF